MFKYTIPYLLQLLSNRYVWKVKTNDKKLYLTFDDGPHPEITLWVLNELEEYNAKATFFCVGDNVKKYPETFQLIKQNAHAVGNHTNNHLNGWKTSNEVYFENIQNANELIQSNLFRPPFGRIKFSQSKIIREKYKIILWNRLSMDYKKNLNIAQSLKAMKQKPHNGNIFVFHDSEKAFENLKILLPEILKYFSGNGYQFCAL